jgi:hypothetical protein
MMAVAKNTVSNDIMISALRTGKDVEGSDCSLC